MAEATSLVRAFYASRRNLLSPADLRSIGPICSQSHTALYSLQAYTRADRRTIAIALPAAIEAHNPKRALLLCDQLLKRTPAFPSALVRIFIRS